jgi:hypothetical protein
VPDLAEAPLANARTLAGRTAKTSASPPPGSLNRGSSVVSDMVICVPPLLR